MAGFRLRRETSLSRSALRETAAELAAQLEAAHGLRARWEGDDVVAISGAGFEGRLALSDEAVDVSVRLGLLASAFERPLRAEIERYLDQHLG